MNYSEIKKTDIANGPGVRVSLFVSGCSHYCKECFNSEAWDPKFGKKFTEETKKKILDLCSHSYISGLSLLGGDPLYPENEPVCLELVKEFKKKFPEKTVWCWTGDLFEDLVERDSLLLKEIDVLIDGEFELDKKDLRLVYMGSSNQRVIDVKKSLETDKVELYKK